MPRNHARLSLSIWADGDWVSLPLNAQWLYAALVSQPDINQAGVVSLTVKRWSHLCVGGSVKIVCGALRVLSDRRYVVIDEDTEELLVRTFIRNDEVWRQPNTLKSACMSARAVQSPKIREALRDELLRLDMAKIETLRTPVGHEPAADVVRMTIKVLGDVRGPHSATPSEGYGEPNGEPNSIDTNADTSPRIRAGEGAGEGVSTSPAVGMNSSSVGPRSEQRGAHLPADFVVTNDWLAWARESFPGVDARAEAAKFVDHWRAASGQSARKRDWKAAWRNWVRKAAEGGPGRQRGRPPTVRPQLPADPKAAFADLRRRAAAQDAARLLGVACILDPQPPSDPTDPYRWERDRAVEWIDQRADKIIAALAHPRAG